MSRIDLNDYDWYCDSCGELLNNQEGFENHGAYHECTNCGFLNKISEEGIISNYDDESNCSSYEKEEHYNYTESFEVNDDGDEVEFDVDIDWDDCDNEYVISYSCDKEYLLDDVEDFFEHFVLRNVKQHMEIYGINPFMISTSYRKR